MRAPPRSLKVPSKRRPSYPAIPSGNPMPPTPRRREEGRVTPSPIGWRRRGTLGRALPPPPLNPPWWSDGAVGSPSLMRKQSGSKSLS